MNDEHMTVHEGTSNIFADLGLPDADELLVKAATASRLIDLINGLNMTQAQVAEMLDIDQPKVFALLGGRLHEFSLERLLQFLLALDQDVEIIVRPKVKDHSRLNVTVGEPR
ncbi:MAG TPA: helix-turn-helix transcriptional regulator [Chloroflexota bacterium]|nr:helix-turn-helix transcriptional regulator [Chloroflexota bacterium]